MVLSSLYHSTTTILYCRDLLVARFNMYFSVSSGLLMMSAFPSSSSKSLTSTPLKSRASVPGSVRQRSRSVESTGDSTSSLLSPIYHDSFELSDEEPESDQPRPVHNMTVTLSEDGAPVSPSRWAFVELVTCQYNKSAPQYHAKSDMLSEMRWTQQAWRTDLPVGISNWAPGSSGLWIKLKRSVSENNRKLWRYIFYGFMGIFYVNTTVFFFFCNMNIFIFILNTPLIKRLCFGRN